MTRVFSGMCRSPRRAPLLILGVTWLLALPTGAEVGVKSVSERTRGMVWESSVKKQALFLPQSILDELSVEELPLAAERRRILELQLEVRRDPDRFLAEPLARRMSSDPCDENPVDAQGSADETFSIDELLVGESYVYYGQIEDVVEGLDVRSGRPAQAVSVRIDRIGPTGSLMPPTPQPRSGETRTVILAGGTVTVEGVELCYRAPAGFYRPTVGEWIIFRGLPSATDASFVEHSILFPVVGGVVQPQPYPRLHAAAEPRSVEQLWNALFRAAAEK